jgi:hypothetical protein
MLREQRAELEERGHVRLPGAFARSAVEAVAERVWSQLEAERGVRRDDPGSWDVPAAWVGLKVLKQEAVYRSLRSPALCAAIDDLMGAGRWRMPRNWGGFLVTFPDCRHEQWSIPSAGWHVDFHYTYEPGTPFGLRVFTFLSEVGPRGGGTLVVSGSQRLVERFVGSMTPAQREEGYAALKKRFNSSHPWLAALTSGESADTERVRDFMERTHEIDGVPVRVEQLCGAPGDVVLAHPWILHTSSPNAGSGPRFMLGQDVYGEVERGRRPAPVGSA